MKKTFFVFLLFLTTVCFSQTEQKIHTYLSVQANRTLYDDLLADKKGIAGLALQTRLSTHSRVEPSLELTTDLFRVRRLGSADEPYTEKVLITGLYGGLHFKPVERFFIEAALGPVHYDKATFLGLKPSVGAYLWNNRLTAKISFVQVYQKIYDREEPFAFLGLAMAAKLF